MNGYPKNLVLSQIRYFLDRVMNPINKPSTAQKKKIYVKFQYLGPQSFHLRKTLRKLLIPAYPQVDFRFIFTNNNTLKNLFPYKDRIPDDLQSDVIYKYDCVRCNSDVSYIGKTSCNLGERSHITSSRKWPF